MARRRASITNVLILVLATAVSAALIGYPVVAAVAWWQADSRAGDVLVYNTTVPTEERRQQRAIDLVLEHLKLESVRFIGAEPGGFDVGAWPTSPPDTVFMIDAYGVYLDDLSLDPEASATTLLTRPLGDPVAPDLEQWIEDGTFVYAEFNVLHAPTPPATSERFQDLFGIDATGWVGHWYSDLSEVGDNLRALAGDAWPAGSGPGLVLVSQSVGDIVVPSQVIVVGGDDLAMGPPMITGTTPDGREIPPTPFLDWFSLIVPADAADVVMWLDLPIEPSAADALAGLGIAAQAPLLILGDRTAYFAGNMSRTAAEFPTRRLAGALEIMRSFPQSAEAAAFYRVTAPTMAWVLDQS